MPVISETKYLTQVGWPDIPHLTEKTKREQLKSCEPHLIGARTRGDPTVSKGRIYPLDITAIQVDPFKISDSWPRVYGFDPSWNRTAALWGAYDLNSDIIFLYGEYYGRHMQPRLHAEAIKTRGVWVPGTADPASRGGSQRDGKQILADYRAAGLKLSLANNAVEAGLTACYDRMTTGRLKVFSTLANFRWEFNIYRRIVNKATGRSMIVKKADHLMDAMRYLVMSGLAIARVRPDLHDHQGYSVGAADAVAGY